ncbi:MAG: hypothetical protein JNL74_12395, partial [Fibrobacteres bacterium]|nr:hypothetical protein [Fibrobacterota bacterium]
VSAVNNGDGTWSLADDVLASVGEGVYNVVASASYAGNIGYDTTTNELTVDLTLPVVTIVEPAVSPRWMNGTVRTITWTATDANAANMPVNISYKVGASGSWNTILDTVAQSGSANWATPTVSDSNVTLRITLADSAGNTGSAERNVFVVNKPGTPLSLTLTPRKRSVQLGTVISFTVAGVDVDNNPITNDVVQWAVIGWIGTVDTAGVFRSSRTGNGYVTASYNGVSTISDTINVFFSNALQSGYNRLNGYLGLDVPFEPIGANIAFAEKPSTSEYVALEGFKQVSPVIDFKGSSPMTHPQDLNVVVTLDSLPFMSQSVDTSKIRLFVFNSTTGRWDVAANSKPGSSRVIRVATKTLFTFVVGVDTLPPVISNISDTIEEYKTGDLFTIAGRIRDNVSKPGAVIFFRSGGASVFDSIPITDSVFDAKVFIRDNGFEYFIRGDDQTNISITQRVNVAVNITAQTSPTAVPANEWRLVSVPMALKKDG